MKKQAILIMYHADYYILEKLLKQIDSDYFDIYLHVDKKTKDFDFNYTKSILQKSNIYFIERLDVKWGTFSQIKCELTILKEAVKRNYSYYHLISGNDLLLKDSKMIYDFYEKNKGCEFVGYKDMDSVSELEESRIKYYHIFNHNYRHNNKIIRLISNKVYYLLLKIQKKLNVNRLKNSQFEIRKGANWFSITNSLAKYVLTQEDMIYKMFRFSHCADELFLQTIVYNSKFKSKIYIKYNDELRDIKRYIDWERGEPYTFTVSDYDDLIDSDCFFARKFSSKIDKEIIDKIYNTFK